MPVDLDVIVPVVLAAGDGTRLGGGKLLLPFRGRPLICHAVRAALAGSDGPVVVVVGADAPAVAAAVRDDVADRPDAAARLTVVENPRWKDGQSTSLRRGVQAAREISAGTLAGVMAILGDQPTILAETVRALADRHVRQWRDDPFHGATRPTYRGRPGNPVVLSSRLFQEVAALQGDVGARAILARLGERLLLYPVEDEGVVRDVDTLDEYESLTRETE
ncbi:MAG: nucleotidyltransferase family protein [Planctomycetes bacterium]|nr:nucleotidyltransferase family protein [Planctomycetota bacterium]MCD7895533.1 nucleotidyltransferase family protein [Planctomycetaceae bacterium]